MIDNIDDDTIEVLCDCGDEHRGRIVGDEDQRLEWYCPVDDKIHSDTNA